jgi:UDP-N-acetylglucosamine 2-epimerase (non-hydrolysing)
MGTRPEAIKLAPVVERLKDRGHDTVVVSTGQHKEMLEQTLALFGIVPELDLAVMQPNQRLSELTARVLTRVSDALAEIQPDVVLVQGDTTTAFAAALAAFYTGLPVGHVEAGLRSLDPRNPFPEEANRRLVAVTAGMHFAPTRRAAANLIREGVASERIVVTGNTVVDALSTLLPAARALRAADPLLSRSGDGRLLLVTSHRRESWGADLESICLALTDLVTRFDDVHVIWPVHLNPNVRTTVTRLLGGTARIHLAPPVDYMAFLQLMERAHLVLTDSGGVQEEAPSLAKPVLVLRKLTERPEACESGAARIVGTDRATIVREASRLLSEPSAYAAMATGINPFGDGHAADRIVDALEGWMQPAATAVVNSRDGDAGVAEASAA